MILYIIISFIPINDNQILSLILKIRKKRINYYFPTQPIVNHSQHRFKYLKDFMEVDGGFIKVDIDRANITTAASYMLKYKRHEWLIIAFEKNNKIDLIWANKGESHFVPILLNVLDQIDISNRYKYQSVYLFHNHPRFKLFNEKRLNSLKKVFDLFRVHPSQRDIDTMQTFSEIYKRYDINMISYICGNTQVNPLFFSISKKLLPFEIIEKEVSDLVNNIFKRPIFWYKYFTTKDIAYIKFQNKATDKPVQTGTIT
jgi:hypothetical protein